MVSIWTLFLITCMEAIRTKRSLHHKMVGIWIHHIIVYHHIQGANQNQAFSPPQNGTKLAHHHKMVSIWIHHHMTYMCQEAIRIKLSLHHKMVSKWTHHLIICKNQAFSPTQNGKYICIVYLYRLDLYYADGWSVAQYIKVVVLLMSAKCTH